MFEAGALIFRIQTVGAQLFKQEQRESKDAFEKTGKAASEAGKQVDESGNATDRTSKKSRDSKKPLEEQAKATEEVGKQSQQSSQQQEKQADSTERQIETAKKLSVGLLVAGLAVSALVGLSVAKFTEFDKAMSQTAAATMATADEQRALGEAALDAGADTAYSASEAAAAEEELAKAGISVADIVGGSLNGALGLAAAGQLAVARSAEIMATTLKQFQLPASEAAHVSDLLAAGAGKAQGSVDDLGNALKFVGPVAAGLGLSIEETTGILALFAEQGIIGEQAGTSLRGVLSSLTSPSKIAADTMKEYGLQVFDANGKMKSAAQIAQGLQDSFAGLTEQERAQALGRIFGNEQITAARILYQGGAKAVDEWTAAVDDSGYAAEQAAMRQDNLAGDIEKLGGAFDTALIRTGAGANDVLREMVQSVTALVDVYGELPAGVQATALVLGVATAAILLFAGGAVGARAKFLELKLMLDATNFSMGRTALLGGAAGLALTGIVAVVALLAQQQQEARAKAEAYLSTLEKGTNAVTTVTREMAKEALAARDAYLWMENQSAYDAAESLGISLDLVTEATQGNVEALEQLEQELTSASAGQSVLAGQAAIVRNAVKGEAASIEEAIDMARQKQEADAATVDSSKSATEAYLESADSVDKLESELRDLIDTINAANNTGQDAVSANISYQDALFKVDEQIRKAREGQEGYSIGLDQTTQSGRDNLSMLNDLAERSQKAADAQYTLDGNTDNYRSTMEAGRQALIDRAQQMGYNADEAARLADQIYRIPSSTEWELLAQTQGARREIDGFFTSYNGRRINVYVDANGGEQYQIAGTTVRYNADGAVYPSVRFFAGGGTVTEHHVAQMARAGDVRVWAEPETGGESYVPHAASKRARSEAIMVDTAAILGGVYIPAGAVGYANGAAVTASAVAAPSIDGARITGRLAIDADGFANLIDARIYVAQQSTAVGLSGGESSR